MIPFFLFLF
jgi:NAD-dependent deacetylase sirtuin 1